LVTHLNSFQWILLAGSCVVIIGCIAALWLLRKGQEPAVRRVRHRTLGVTVLVLVVPVRILLEARLSVGVYLLVLVAVVGGGMTLFLRARGLTEWP